MSISYKTQFKSASEKIEKYFESINQSVFRRENLSNIYLHNNGDWKISDAISTDRLIDLFIEHTAIKEHCFTSPYTNSTRYTWGNYTNFDLIQSLRYNSYFTHLSALELHGLIDNNFNKYYLNYEQSKKYSNSNLEQNRIDTAFSNAPRTTTNIARNNNIEVYVLSGKYTNRLNVITMSNDTQTIFTTDLERTMIDIVVRPHYSGGIINVLNMYKRASSKLSVDKLIKTLEKMEYVYPYHQCIGFLMERSNCYKESAYEKLKQFGLVFNFYLCHKINKKEYSRNWKLYYPSSIQ